MTKIILSLNDKCLVQYSGDETLSFVVFFSFLLPNVVLGVVTLGTKLEPVLGVEVALGVGVVPGALLVVGGLAGGLLPVDVVPSALLLVDVVGGWCCWCCPWCSVAGGDRCSSCSAGSKRCRGTSA